MGTVHSTYSHAAPYIRRRMIDEVANAIHTRTQRDRAAGFAAIGAYAMSLSIIAKADDQTVVEGIPDIDSVPIDALREVLRYLGPEDNITRVLSAEGAAQIRARIERFDAIQNRERRTDAGTQPH